MTTNRRLRGRCSSTTTAHYVLIEICISLMIRSIFDLQTHTYTRWHVCTVGYMSLSMGVLSEINLADDDDDNSYVCVNRRNSCIYLRLRSVIIRANTFISTVAVLVCRCLFVFYARKSQASHTHRQRCKMSTNTK